MSSALFGILQLDKGEPPGYANIFGLVEVWLQDAGGFAMVGLIVYLLYALATPTDKSQSERLRVPVSLWMVVAAGLSIVCYTAYLALLWLGKGGAPEPPMPMMGMPVVIPPSTFHKELRPIILAIAGTFALLGIGEPFARDMAKILRRNFSFGLSGVRRFCRSFVEYTAGSFTPQRLTYLFAFCVGYALLGLGSYLLSNRLFSIWAGCLYVAIGVFVCALLVLMLFEAEGPIWAIAKLSFKEAIRNQLLWIFLLMLIPFAFRNVLMGRVKPVDEIRGIVGVSSLFITVLLLFVAALVAALAIPNDIKNLNIYTIVSKPVERFEIVLGRFVGYVSLFTLVLIASTGVSLVMVDNVVASASPKAIEESYKARVPLRGKLEFASRKVDFEGTNVGREFDYRKYIAGHELSPQRAIYHFADIPESLAHAEGDRVPMEFTFDVYKMTKGEQNRGVFVNLRLVTHHAPQRPPTANGGGEWQWVDANRYEDYKKAVLKLEESGIKTSGALPGTPAWKEVNKLAEEFGIFEIRGKEIFDYAVSSVDVPSGLFRNALKDKPPIEKYRDKMGLEVERPAPRLNVFVKCESGGQMLGMAEPDLYLLEAEQPFEWNFLKATVGLWCRLCIIVALAVACSTYLSGILGFLATGFIFLLGYFSEHLNDLAFNRNIGGGPFRSLSQLIKAEQPTSPLTESAGAKVLQNGDTLFAWFVRRIQNMIPDVDALSWSTFVSEGFNVNTEYLIVNLLVTFGYILPWGILAYYLMKSREVAA